ncbi:hypothetical protein ACFLTV_03445 [Chloroflexota bacterium]
METTNVLTEEKLYRFLKEHGDNRVKRELLAFWSKHPCAKISRRVICDILHCTKLEAEVSLRHMVEEGLLDKHITNGITLYTLTKNEEKRRSVLKLAYLGWDQRNIMVKRMEQCDKSEPH